ncbi:MAG: hypothetical protein RL189_1620 [Pseudomonadota bacterium]|jgi:hypothetical protein
MLCYGMVFYVFVKENFDTLIELAPLSEATQQNLLIDLQHTVAYLTGTSFVFLLAVGVIGLVFSHQVAGPLFKIKQVCGQINRGDKDARIRLRPTDHFRDTVAYLNYTFDRFERPGELYYEVIKSRRHQEEIFSVSKIAQLVAEGSLDPSDLLREFEKENPSVISVGALLQG